MKTRLVLTLVFLAGLVCGALFSPLRYTFTAAGNMPAIWRCDRLTGAADFGTPGSAWRAVKPDEKQPIP